MSTELLIYVLGLVGFINNATQLLPQVVKTLRTRDVSGLSLGSNLQACFGALVWGSFALLQDIWAIVLTNIAVLVSALVLIAAIFVFGRKPPRPLPP